MNTTAHFDAAMTATHDSPSQATTLADDADERARRLAMRHARERYAARTRSHAAPGRDRYTILRAIGDA